MHILTSEDQRTLPLEKHLHFTFQRGQFVQVLNVSGRYWITIYLYPWCSYVYIYMSQKFPPTKFGECTYHSNLYMRSTTVLLLTVVCMSTVALYCSNFSTTSTCPCSDAIISAVKPFWMPQTHIHTYVYMYTCTGIWYIYYVMRKAQIRTDHPQSRFLHEIPVVWDLIVQGRKAFCSAELNHTQWGIALFPGRKKWPGKEAKWRRSETKATYVLQFCGLCRCNIIIYMQIRVLRKVSGSRNPRMFR